MNTELLRSFIEVGSQQSYTDAAKTLYLSQPTVYQHVRSLEQLLGVKLVCQVGKRVVLTSEGKTVADQAIKVLGEVNNLLNSVLLDHEQLRTGKLDIVVGTTFGDAILPLCLGVFLSQYPGLSLRVAVLHDTDDIDNAVFRLGYDGGFHSGDRWRSGITKEPIINDRLVAAVPIGHPLSGNSSVSAADLQNEALICYAKPFGLRYRIDSWAADQNCELSTAVELNSQTAMVTAVATGAGVAIVSTLAALPLMEAGEVVTIELDPPIHRDWYFVHRSDTKIPIGLKMLVETLATTAARMHQDAIKHIKRSSTLSHAQLIGTAQQNIESSVDPEQGE